MRRWWKPAGPGALLAEEEGIEPSRAFQRGLGLANRHITALSFFRIGGGWKNRTPIAHHDSPVFETGCRPFSGTLHADTQSLSRMMSANCTGRTAYENQYSAVEAMEEAERMGA